MSTLHLLRSVLRLMASPPSDTGATKRASIEKGSGFSHEDEKLSGLDISVIEADQGDEALKLVGPERTEEFTEEYNAKLRRKLVS